MSAWELWNRRWREEKHLRPFLIMLIITIWRHHHSSNWQYRRRFIQPVVQVILPGAKSDLRESDSEIVETIMHEHIVHGKVCEDYKLNM